MNGYMIITNNPMVRDKLGETHNVIYQEISYEDILKDVRDRIHEGHTLLSHPLSGSVKPNETPYKSIMVSEKKGRSTHRGLRLSRMPYRRAESLHFGQTNTNQKYMAIFS